MIERFRTWLAEKLAPDRPPAAPDAAQLAYSKLSVVADAIKLQLGAQMSIQANLLQQLNQVTELLSAASLRLASQNAAVNQQITDLTAQVAQLQAENQRLRDAAASGEASNIEIAAAIAALAEAARKLGAPSEPEVPA